MGPAVLVVDDAATVRLYYRQVLGSLGCAVVEAWNGAEGLEKALVEPPQLILLDVNMPVLDGYSMLRALRREPALRAIPVVMITTAASGDETQVFVDDPARFGTFGPEWVRQFFGSTPQ